MNYNAPEPNHSQHTQTRPDYYVSGWDLTWMLCRLEPARWLSHDALTVEACRLRLMSEGFDDSEVGDGLVIPVAEEEDRGEISFVYDVHFVIKDEFVSVQLAVGQGELLAWLAMFEHFEKCARAVVDTMVARADEEVFVGVLQSPQATTMDIKVVNHGSVVWSLTDIHRTIPDLIAAIQAHPRMDEK